MGACVIHMDVCVYLCATPWSGWLTDSTWKATWMKKQYTATTSRSTASFNTELRRRNTAHVTMAITPLCTKN